MVFGNPYSVLKPVRFLRLNFCCFLLTASDGPLVLLDDLSGVVLLDHLPRVVDQMRRQERIGAVGSLVAGDFGEDDAQDFDGAFIHLDCP